MRWNSARAKRIRWTCHHSQGATSDESAKSVLSNLPTGLSLYHCPPMKLQTHRKNAITLALLPGAAHLNIIVTPLFDEPNPDVRLHNPREHRTE